MDCKKLVRVFLAEQGANFSEAAERMGVSRSGFSDKLRRNDLRVSDLERIAAAYGCRVVITFTEQPEGKQPEQ